MIVVDIIKGIFLCSLTAILIATVTDVFVIATQLQGFVCLFVHVKDYVKQSGLFRVKRLCVTVTL